MLETHSSFPEFALRDQFANTWTKQDFEGHWLIVLFYEKDASPQTTLELKSFNSRRKDFEKLGAKILCVSRDDARAHHHFGQKYGIDLTLLSDVDGRFSKACDIPVDISEGSLHPKTCTVLVDADGRVRKVYENFNIMNHESQVMNDLKDLQLRPLHS